MELTKEIAQEIRVISQKATGEQLLIAKEILGNVGGKWNLRILYILAVTGHPIRVSEIYSSLDGISYKILIQILRALERDGLIVRSSHKNQVPPRVDYELSRLGHSFFQTSTPLCKWIVTHIEQFEKARIEFKIRNSRKTG